MENSNTVLTEANAASDGRKGKKGARLDKLKKSRLYDVLYEKGVLWFVVSFAVSAVIMVLAFRKQLIHPFGDEQILVVDLWHQYYPFFRVLREKLLTGGSFLYSWQNGLGTNFLSLISYYAASPLNWISVFFSEDYVRDALTYILVAKIGFCSAFFSCFLRYTFRRKDISIVPFSVMFSLCSYLMGYYWNVMWIDTIALFPLVMLGVVAICRERKWLTFTIALALSLISNYYIGYFTCIFTVFMFAAAIIIYAKGIKDFFAKLWIIARSAVLGIAAGGFILLPAYCALQLTHSANNTFPKDMSTYEKWTDILMNLYSYNPPATKEGLPNFACGMLAVVLFGVFLFGAGIKIREKLSALFMLALITVSCNINILNYIWHGFHFTNMIPYRFAFIFSFVLIAAAYRAYDVILSRGVKIYQIILMLAFPFAVFWLNYKKQGLEAFNMGGELYKSIVITLAFVLIFIAVKVFPFKNPALRNSVMSLFITAAVIAECSGNAAVGVRTVGSSNYNAYPLNNDRVQSLLAAAEESDDSLFYRTEVTKTYTLNDSALYGYNGISQFSSSANVSVTKFMKKLGLYGSEAGNRYYYSTATPVVNSMLGIKYLISKSGHLYSTEPSLEFSGSAVSSYMYENKHALSLGYMVESSALEGDVIAHTNPFDYQNKLLQLAAGVDEDCFTPQPVALAAYNNATVGKKAYGSYSLYKDADHLDSADCYAEYTFNGVEGAYLYGYATNGICDKVNVKNGDQAVEENISIKDYPVVFPMGNAQEGETALVRMKASADKERGDFKLMVYAMSEEVFLEAYENLADEQLEITSFEDSVIEGTINAKKDGIMLLSMPYEKGWSVYVDGEKTETMPLFGALMGAEIPAGQHDIRLVYIPEGFKAGTAATAASVVIIIMLAVLDRKRRRKLAAEAGETEAVTAEEETLPENEEIEAVQAEETPSDNEEIEAVPNTEEEKKNTADGEENA